MAATRTQDIAATIKQVRILEAAGADLRFDCEGATIHGADTDAPFVTYTQGGTEHRVDCDFIAGCDSGHGAKPQPGQLLAFAERIGLSPDRIVMVGDSTHDLIAGRSAGMQTVAVLTGLAEAAVLAPYADAVLPDIGHLPAWLAG